jgi:two-component system, NarL family, response regulator NreC
MGADLHLATPTSASGRTGRPRLPIHVVLADDHASVRRSLSRLLDAQEDFELVAEGADLATAVRHVQSHVPHVLVLDLHMPNGSGLETIRRLRANVPETEIVVLTMNPSPPLAQQAIDSGAVGFVLKDKADTELPAAVRSAANGREYVSSHVVGGLDALRRATDGDGLSPRETKILTLIALGYTSAEIAAELHLSRRTVETHRARIYSKLALTRRAELVQFALQRHLIGD